MPKANHKVHILINRVENTADGREMPWIINSPMILPSVVPNPPGIIVAIPSIDDKEKMDIE